MSSIEVNGPLKGFIGNVEKINPSFKPASPNLVNCPSC